MGTKLSICGKGGSGKSTLTSLLAKQAQENGLKVVVVDSDELDTRLENSLGQKEIPVLGAIPNDPEVFEAGLDGRSIGTCRSTLVVKKIFQKLSSNMAL